MKLKVDVREDHIANGARCSTDYCPIALAIYELVPEGSRVDVDGEIRVTVPGEPYTHVGELSEVAFEFIERFDGHDAVEPFSFEVELS